MYELLPMVMVISSGKKCVVVRAELRRVAHSIVGAGIWLHPSPPHSMEACPGLLPAAAGHGLIVCNLHILTAELYSTSGLMFCISEMHLLACRLYFAHFPYSTSQEGQRI